MFYSETRQGLSVYKYPKQKYMDTRHLENSTAVFLAFTQPVVKYKSK